MVEVVDGILNRKNVVLVIRVEVVEGIQNRKQTKCSAGNRGGSCGWHFKHKKKHSAGNGGRSCGRHLLRDEYCVEQ